jgi:hypothetical protein
VAFLDLWYLMAKTCVTKDEERCNCAHDMTMFVNA